MPKSSKLTLSLIFFSKIFVCFFIAATRAVWSTCFPLLDHLKISRKDYKLQSSSLCNFLQTPCKYSPRIFILTLPLYFLPLGRETTFHTPKKKCKII
jgi:hypothetical protein